MLLNAIEALIVCWKTVLYIRKFSQEFNFPETSHMLSFVKIKPSRIGDITLSFTDLGKSCPVCDFFTRKCVF